MNDELIFDRFTSEIFELCAFVANPVSEMGCLISSYIIPTGVRHLKCAYHDPIKDEGF